LELEWKGGRTARAMELEREGGRTAGTLHKLDMIELEDGGVVVISLNKKIISCTTKIISSKRLNREEN
jgi:hypothetical protein